MKKDLNSNPMEQITLETKSVKTVQDVETFFAELLAKNVNFHPDDSFEDIVYFEQNIDVFSKKEAKRLDKLMDDSMKICNKISEDKIYDIALKQFNAWHKNADKKGFSLIN